MTGVSFILGFSPPRYSLTGTLCQTLLGKNLDNPVKQESFCSQNGP